MSLEEGKAIRDRFVLNWVQYNGDNTLALDHKLNENSLVVDFGGYTGEWSEKIFKRYHCFIEIYEPFSTFINQLKNRFQSSNEKIKIFEFAVGKNNSSAFLVEDDLATRIIENDDGDIKIIDASSALRERKIDLLKMNIEGSEYEVFESFFNNDVMKNIRSLFIQFHPIDDLSVEKYMKIQDELSKTHTCIFRFPFIWEKWELK